VTPEEAAATPTTAMGAEPGSQTGTSSPAAVAKASQKPAERPARGSGAQDEMLSKLAGDAPFCDTCGHITVRNGTCYKCLNCGNSMGCS
jgi:ribonucleoside-diphosphate reductase alpha chain